MGEATAVARRTEDTASAVSPFGGNGEGFATAQRIAQALAASSVVPDTFRGNLPNVLVAMEYAHRLGASVLAVMQNLDLIHGRPALRAKFLIGTVNACGRFTPIRYRFQGEEGQDTWGCRAVAKDKSDGEECVGPLITIALAKAEGWYTKAGSKWKTIPELMLMYRSGAWWTNVYAPDLSLGLRTAEEYEDMGPPPASRAQAVVAALDRPDPTPATAVDLEELARLRDLAREASILDVENEEALEAALRDQDGAAVQSWIQSLTQELARTAGAQGSLV